MKKTKVPFPENLKKKEKLDDGDLHRIRKYAGIKSPVYVSEIYRGERKETDRIKKAYDKLMKIKEYERKLLEKE